MELKVIFEQFEGSMGRYKIFVDGKAKEQSLITSRELTDTLYESRQGLFTYSGKVTFSKRINNCRKHVTVKFFTNWEEAENPANALRDRIKQVKDAFAKEYLYQEWVVNLD